MFAVPGACRVSNRSDNIEPSAEPAEVGAKQLLKLLVELGPLVVFFVANSQFGILVGTQLFVIATIISLAVSRVVLGKIATMPLVSGVFVIVFGGLTVYLADDLFIKMKPTIVNTIFAVLLFGGLAFGKSWLKYLFDDAFRLTDEGWRKLTFRWACFFVLLAVLNEIVWRTMSTDFWVSFKLIGIMPLTLIFAISQIGLLKKYELSAN
ncbi:MAG: septation protein A [Hyphomicrobiaceae bacterium]|nr:septation protein A [Hyphomicrobiaceae bacterium]